MLPLKNETITLDPAGASNAASRQLVGQLYETLLDWSTDEMHLQDLVPELLARQPLWSADGRDVHFQLRLPSDPQAPRFSSDRCFARGVGRSIVASDVRNSWQRLADHPQGRALLRGRIEGWDAWADDHTRPAPQIIVDDAAGTVDIQLTRPQRDFESLLANPQLAVVPAECVRHYDGSGPDRPAFRNHPVGSGPFRLDHAHSTPRIFTLLRAEDRGLAVRAGLATVTLSIVAAANTRLLQFQAGDLALFYPEGEQLQRLVTSPTQPTLRPGLVPEHSQLRRFSEPKVNVLLFVMKDPGLATDPDLRRALSLAFDGPRYNNIIRTIYAGQAAGRLLPPGIGGSHGEFIHPFAPAIPDLPRAQALLRGRSERIPLRYATTATALADSEIAILRNAYAPLGVELQAIRDNNYFSRITQKGSSIQAFSVLIEADHFDPLTFFENFTCEGALHPFIQYCDRDYDSLVEQLSATPPAVDTKSLILALERRLGETTPMRPIEYPVLWQLSQPWLTGILRHPISGLRIERLRVEPSLSGRERFEAVNHASIGAKDEF